MMRTMKLRTKFLIGAVGIVVILGAAMMVFVRSVLHQRVVEVLQRRGVSLARQLAEQGLDPVLTEHNLQLELMIKNDKKAEQDVKYIYVIDHRGRVLAHTFSGGFPVELKKINPVAPGRPYSFQHFVTEEGHVLDIAYPLLNGKAGTLHLGIAGDDIESTVRTTVRQFVSVILAVLAVGGIAAVVFARMVTKPLLELEEAVAATGQGERDRRVGAVSNDEIGQLASAFNNMVEQLKQAEDDREKLISDLRIVLDNVKTLRGLIPICASCKKIRDDKGYWGQIEAYISKHSDAEFSHGLCPECAAKLYPGYSAENKKKD